MYWFSLHFSRQSIDIYAQVDTFCMGSVTLTNLWDSNYWTVLYLRSYDNNRKIIVGEIKTTKKSNKNLYISLPALSNSLGRQLWNKSINQIHIWVIRCPKRGNTTKLPCAEHHINLHHSAFSFLLLCSFIEEQNVLEVQRPTFYPKLFD